MNRGLYIQLILIGLILIFRLHFHRSAATRMLRHKAVYSTYSNDLTMSSFTCDAGNMLTPCRKDVIYLIFGAAHASSNHSGPVPLVGCHKIWHPRLFPIAQYQRVVSRVEYQRYIGYIHYHLLSIWPGRASGQYPSTQNV
ncbi:hypothetical protein JOM56_010993 [Amanita muscaria]